MRRRKLLKLVGLLACCALAGLLYFRTTAGVSPVHWENVNAIKVGMTRAEVEALLGAPPGVYATGSLRTAPCPPSKHPWTLWIGQDQATCVAFDEKGFRIGYGKGFYDKYLADCSIDCLKVGFCYFEPVDSIEDSKEFDVPLNLCITPQNVYVF